MKALGYMLVTGGFLGGSFLAVRQAEAVDVGSFLLALAVGATGVALVRVATYRAARHAATLEANIGAIEASLAALSAGTEALQADQEAVGVYGLRHRIDADFPEHLDAFVRARKSVAHSFGLQAYAELMNPFAAGERYLNRVWSASTDGYVDEAHDYLARAREQFAEALAVFRSARAATGPR